MRLQLVSCRLGRSGKTDLTIDQWLSLRVNGQQPEKLLGWRIED